MTSQADIQKELARRKLRERHADKRESLVEMIKFYFEKEKNMAFHDNWHYYVLEDYLKRALDGEFTRLIINIPPWSGKTEFITKCFPVWTLWNYPTKEIIATGYSTSLTQEYSWNARDYYKSDTYQMIFPYRPDLRSDQDTKEYWKNEAWWSYYATGVGGSITWRRWNIFIIDDPLKADEAANSRLSRDKVNNWYQNTVLSRLHNPAKDLVIIIMQRTHEDDLCGFLIDLMEKDVWEKFEIVSLPSIATKNETWEIDWRVHWRKTGDPLDKERFPLESLEKIKKSLWMVNFECQYQQNPLSKLAREFHEEWFFYFDEIPAWWRIFTAVDPAFSRKETADYSAIVTCKFIDDRIYVLDYFAWRIDPWQLIDEIINQYMRWLPEKIGVEAVQAQRVIGVALKNKLAESGKYPLIEDITNAGDKETRIRWLIPHFRDGRVRIRNGIVAEVRLEDQLVSFPRGAHDDVIDALRMTLQLHELRPGSKANKSKFHIEYTSSGRPKIIN